MPQVSRPQDVSEARRFDLLVDDLTDYAIYLMDVDGFITSWNVGAERIKGYAATEIVGQHFSRFFSSDDKAAGLPEQILAQARAAGRHEAEGWRVCKGGRRFWANAIIQAVHDERGAFTGFAKITRDITERLIAQEALQQSEKRFRLLVEGVTDYAVYMLDPSGVVVSWNTGAERLKGYAADEIVGQHFSRFYTKEDREKGVPVRVLETAAREGRYEGEGWRVRKDGGRFWASVVVDAIRSQTGAIEGFAKVTRDITERRAALEAVRESERQFRLLVANVTDYAIYMLDLNGIVTSWNAGAARIKGYTADEIIGQHFSRFYTERDRAAGTASRALRMAAEVGRYEAEGWRLRKDGTMFWASAVIDAIRDEQGKLIGFAKITRDITDRREAQIARQEAEAQRAYAQKMDALGELTGGVAHDFNNILAIIGAGVRMIGKANGDPEKITAAARSVEHAVQAGATLTRQLQTFSRRQAINPTVVHLSERVAAFQTMMAASLGGKVKLAAMIGPESWPVKVDPGEFELALINLALNARDAMPDGGTIAVTSENVVLSPGDIDANIEGEFVALRVNDTGSGIAPDVLARVFEPFFTTKRRNNKGTGLGLAQVHGFARQSGGAVRIESELGKGTTITLYLPRAMDSAPGVSANPTAETARGGAVLVVDDNPEVGEITAAMLRQLGYEVHAASDAEAGLQAIERQNFDLVVSDILMPGVMDGLAFARVVRERKPRVPVILVTGYGDAAAKAAPEFKVLRKPFELAELSRVAARVIAEAQQPPTSNVVRLRNPRPIPDGN